MTTTLSIVKADIGSIEGLIKPGERLSKRVQKFVENRCLEIAHKPAWQAFVAG